MYSDYEGKFMMQQGKVIDEPSDAICFSTIGFVYEVIRVLDGKLLLFQSHLERLKHSIELLKWPALSHTNTLYSQLNQLIELNGIINQNIKIRVDFVSGELNTILYPIISRYPSPNLYHEGAATALYTMERNDPNAKAFDNQMLIVREALVQSGLQEFLLVDHQGNITEGSKSNVIFIKGNTLYSAPDKDILLGISRSVLKNAVNDTDFNWVEQPISAKEIQKFDGAFLTGTSIHLLPIHQIEDFLIETEKSRVFIKLTRLFLDQIEKENMEDLG